MRRALALAAAALALLPAAAAAKDTTSTSGPWLTDQHGRVLLARGINLVAKRPPYTPESVGFGGDDAAFLAARGFDTVRLGVLYAGVEPQRGQYDDAYLDSIGRTVALLAAHHIRAQLDFHQDMYNERYQGQGFPAWAALDDGLPAQPQAGFPGNYLVQPALQRAEDNFYANKDGLVDHYAAAWAHVATRFRGVSGVLGYDLINEPMPGTAPVSCARPEGCPAFEADVLAPFYAKVTAAIRTVDRRTPISYEPTAVFGSGGGTALPRLNDPHAVFGWHLYCPGGPCPDIEEGQFRRAADHAGGHEPQLLSEFGSTKDTSVIERVQDEADRHLVGWMEWTYFSNGVTDTGGTPNLVNDPSRPPTGANVDAAQAAALTRPHATAIAGTPVSTAYDKAVRRLVVRYRPRPGVTRILVPRAVYPRGVRALVRGGRVVRRRGGVVLVSARRARQVLVVVTPRR